MASAINIASSEGTVGKNLPTQAESDNSARSRTVTTMLSGFANECLTERGFYPGMTQKLETLKAENVALRDENTALRAGNAALRNTQSSMETSMKRLQQDNEILDRALKSIGPEREFKDRADRYHALFTASPEALPAVCHDLQQEVERLRRQYSALTSTTERFVNDGLALGVLVKIDNSPDDILLNFDYQRPPQARAAPSNVDQNMHQQQPYMNNRSATISDTSHQSTGSVHLTSQTASQPQTFAHRTSNNVSELMSPADQRRHYVPFISRITHERPVTSISMQGQVLQAQYYANAPQSNRVPAQVGIHSHSQPQPRSQPSTTCPYPSRTITHPQRSASSPHPSSQVQMISQGRPTPFENLSSSSSVRIAAQVHDVQIDHKKPIQRPAPSTPQSDKSISPDWQRYPTLPPPLLIRTPLKRARIDNVSLSPSKRMRLDGKEPTAPVHPAEAPTVPRGVELMVQDVVPSSHLNQPVAGNIIVQSPDLKFAGTTEKGKLASPSNSLASVEPHLENVEYPHSKLMSDNPAGAVILNVGSRQTPNNAEVEGSEVDEAGRDKEGKEEGDKDEDETGCTEKEALGEVLKLEHSGNVCKLCRYPDKYTDAVFDRDTPTSVLVSHFTTVHPAVWTRLRSSSVPTLTPTAG
ncbi:hypothetical protein F5877DRAFT_71214 [Lentinula edodes]|nr:hypothetical protein F5877DRAFT_71214 [Lentinula edodes]